MNKKQLIDVLVETEHFETKVAAERCLNEIVGTITKTVSNGEPVEIFGFGKFYPAFQKGKSGTVPGTDRKYQTDDKFVPRFKASKQFKDSTAAVTDLK